MNPYAAAVNPACNYSEARVVIRYRSQLPCPGDLNNDRSVNGADLGSMLSQWGPCGGCNADLDRNGIVEGGDMAVLLSGWGACP